LPDFPPIAHNFVPYNGKIADINEADVLKHTLDLSATLPETRTIVAVILDATRVAGSGDLLYYPNEGTRPFGWIGANRGRFVIIAPGTQRLQYAQTNAGDDWDLYCMGYVVVID